MPNHVKNIVKMEGITKLPLFKTEYDEYEKRDVVCFDFNKIIPMPESLNMVSGSLETLAIEAVNRRLSQRRYRFQQGYSKPQMTDEEYRIRLESHEKTEEELLELGLQYISNKLLHGMIGAVIIGEQSGTPTPTSRRTRTQSALKQPGPILSR